jgi:hypothetical protein
MLIWAREHYFLTFILAAFLLKIVDVLQANTFKTVRFFKGSKCDICGARSYRLCDGADGTCKASLCYYCNSPSGKLDLCPRHAQKAA